VDGPDHCGVLKFEADRRRDVHLQLEGFAVLRFTNDQILGDVATVRSQIERFIQISPHGKPK
jgi:very-short-patch-repair endonuclease